MLLVVALFLLSMGVGYMVALRATEEVGFLKTAGNVIAVIMIAGSIAGILWSGYCAFKNCGRDGSICPFKKAAPAQVVQS